MAEYDNTNKGTLSRNKDKDKPDANPKWPDHKGSINVDGAEYWLSAWIKDGPHGKFFSLSLQPKEEIGSNSKPPSKKPSIDDSDIPFANPYKGRLSYVV
jgi:hypothetical protein